MAKALRLQNASVALLRRQKNAILAGLVVPAEMVRASCVSQRLTCGKANCRCQRGHKHGPFLYLVQCVHTGNTRKFLLKTAGQKDQARAAVMAYKQFQEKLERLSQINTELLRRGEPMTA